MNVCYFHGTGRSSEADREGKDTTSDLKTCNFIGKTDKYRCSYNNRKTRELGCETSKW